MPAALAHTGAIPLACYPCFSGSIHRVVCMWKGRLDLINLLPPGMSAALAPAPLAATKGMVTRGMVTKDMLSPLAVDAGMGSEAGRLVEASTIQTCDTDWEDAGECWTPCSCGPIRCVPKGMVTKGMVTKGMLNPLLVQSCDAPSTCVCVPACVRAFTLLTRSCPTCFTAPLHCL